MSIVEIETPFSLPNATPGLEQHVKELEVELSSPV